MKKMNKNWLLTICTVFASLVFTVTTNAQVVVVFSNDFEDGDMLPEIGSATLVEESATASIVPVAVAPDETLGNNVLLLDQNTIELDLTLNLTDTLSLIDGNTVTIDFDYAARRTNGVSRTIFVEAMDTNGNTVLRFLLGEAGSLGVGQNAARQRPGFSVFNNDTGNSSNMPFGDVPGAFWWGSDATPDTFDVGRDAHISLTIGESTFDFSSTSQGGVEFTTAEPVANFGGTSANIAEITITSFGAVYGGYFDNIQVAGVVAEVIDVVKGDADLDGDVDFGDIPAFITVLQSGEFQPQSDADCSGAIDFSDIPAFIAILQAG